MWVGAALSSEGPASALPSAPLPSQRRAGLRCRGYSRLPLHLSEPVSISSECIASQIPPSRREGLGEARLWALGSHSRNRMLGGTHKITVLTY